MQNQRLVWISFPSVDPYFYHIKRECFLPLFCILTLSCIVRGVLIMGKIWRVMRCWWLSGGWEKLVNNTTIVSLNRSFFHFLRDCWKTCNVRLKNYLTWIHILCSEDMVFFGEFVVLGICFFNVSSLFSIVQLLLHLLLQSFDCLTLCLFCLWLHICNSPLWLNLLAHIYISHRTFFCHAMWLMGFYEA